MLDKDIIEEQIFYKVDGFKTFLEKQTKKKEQ